VNGKEYETGGEIKHKVSDSKVSKKVNDMDGQ
jgi:hypothetical protein